MLQEIYCRNADDPGYQPTQLTTSNALEAFLTKLRMIIFTNKGDILGHYDLGLDLEIMLFELNFNSGDLTREFNNQIGLYAPDCINYNINIEVNFVPGSVRDIAYIDIYIDGTKYLGVVVK
jgi:hypothetical protein